jgi:hypothetical protein
MDEKRYFCIQRRQLRKGWNADDYVIAHPAGLNNGLIGVLGDQLASEMCNHRILSLRSTPLKSVTEV